MKHIPHTLLPVVLKQTKTIQFGPHTLLNFADAFSVRAISAWNRCV